MTNLNICRLCLADNVIMYDIIETPLQEVYEKLTNILFEENKMPQAACYLCYAQLQKCQRLKTQCLKANALLTNVSVKLESEHTSTLENREPPNFIYKLSMSHPEVHIDISPKEDFECVDDTPKDVKKERVSEGHDINEEETLSIKEERSNVDSESTDSEDNVPLNFYKSNKRTSAVKQVKVKKKEKRVKKEVEKKTKGLNSENIEVVVLTKQQQLKEFVQRSKSLNYLNSPFKCDLCYKGFIDSKAYSNHQEKHEESYGTHECHLCRLRYVSERKRNAHAAMSHARRYKCLKCDRVTITATQARDHEKWHQGYIYECKLCGKKFGKPTSYLTHIRNRHPSEHVCEICGNTYVGWRGLSMHKMKTHKHDAEQTNTTEPPSKRYCSDCDVQFVTVTAWKRHMLTSQKHSNIREQSSGSCFVCGEYFERGSLATHVRTHRTALRHDNKKVSPQAPLATVACEKCGAHFSSHAKLKFHNNRMHLGLKYVKDVICEICGKKCTSNAMLRYHQRVHTGERPYACSSCHKRFNNKNQMRVHMRTHTGEKPYSCEVCAKKFAQKPALNRHSRVHTGAKPYECQYCSKAFSQKNTLDLHVKRIHLKMPRTPKKPKTGKEGVVKNVSNNIPSLVTL